jgi:DNA-binding HxlR family transcriptional regulator
MAIHSQKTCPISKVADLLSDPWTMLIIRDLLRQPMHFSELEKSLDGVSSRTLTLKLKRLVKEKILSKDTASHLYSVTTQGAHLGDIIKAMGVYGKKWM